MTWINRRREPADPYDALGLRDDATAEEVKWRYRELALKHHPDRDGGDGERFKEIRQAYGAILQRAERAAASGGAGGGAPRGDTLHMEMVPVDSSNLVAAGYDRRTGTLRVEFKSSVYDYYGVPGRVYLGLLSARSKGSYHARHIKWEYEYSRVG